MKIRPVNIVATLDLSTPINLELLMTYLSPTHTIRYEPKRFPGLIVKTASVSFLIFRTGKIVISGCKSEKEIEEAAKMILRSISKIVPELPPRIRILVQNAVYTAELPVEPIDLETLSEKIQNSMYDPEYFPGLIYKTPRATVLLFSTGKMVIAGTKTLEDALKTLDEIKSLIEKQSQ